MPLESPESNPSDLEARFAAQTDLLAKYRRFVGKLATNPSKDSAWYTAKAWAPQDFWWAIAQDLETEAEQQAFLFR